jgi:hypothetical protein
MTTRQLENNNLSNVSRCTLLRREIVCEYQVPTCAWRIGGSMEWRGCQLDKGNAKCKQKFALEHHFT